MRTLFCLLSLFAVTLLLAAGTVAQDKKTEKKEVVLKGLIACNKCELAKSTECETVIVVKDEKKKETIYFFDAASHAKYHDGVCAAAAKGTVTGFVTEKDKKKVISVKKLEYAK